MQDAAAPRKEEEVFSPEEVAKKLKISRKTVYEWIRRGKLPSMKLCYGALIRIRQKDIDALFTPPAAK